jgi:hypothetical protein
MNTCGIKTVRGLNKSQERVTSNSASESTSASDLVALLPTGQELVVCAAQQFEFFQNQKPLSELINMKT